MTFSQEDISKEYGKCLSYLSRYYIDLLASSDELKSARFALNILRSFINISKIIKLLNNTQKHHLLDSVSTHRARYIALIDKYQNSELRNNFDQVSTDLIKILQPASDNLVIENDDEAKLYGLILNLVSLMQKLYAEQSFTDNLASELQAYTIAYNCPEINIHQQTILASKLMLTREVFQLCPSSHIESEAFKREFYLNPVTVLKALRISDSELGFKKIMDLFAKDHESLTRLSEEKLSNLYDRLKNLDPIPASFYSLLSDIHNEAKIRYSLIQVSENGYHLLKRFQVFDEFLQKVNNFGFAIAECFLFHDKNIINSVLSVLREYIELIKNISANKSSIINDLLNKIKVEIASTLIDRTNLTQQINLIDAQLATLSPAPNAKKFTELDKFQILTLRNYIEYLLNNIKNLLNKNALSVEFLSEQLINKLVRDYHSVHVANSIAKLRIIEHEKEEVRNLLAHINIVNILCAKSNDESGYNFFKQSQANKTINTKDYVLSVLRDIAHNCNSNQLIIFYESLSTIKDNLLRFEVMQIIKHEADNRVQFYNIFKYFFTARMQEYRDLSNLKQKLNQALLSVTTKG